MQDGSRSGLLDGDFRARFLGCEWREVDPDEVAGFSFGSAL